MYDGCEAKLTVVSLFLFLNLPYLSDSFQCETWKYTESLQIIIIIPLISPSFRESCAHCRHLLSGWTYSGFQNFLFFSWTQVEKTSVFQPVDLLRVQDKVGVLSLGQDVVHRHNTVRPGGAAAIGILDFLVIYRVFSLDWFRPKSVGDGKITIKNVKANVHMSLF